MEVSCEHVKLKLESGETFLLVDCREREEHAIARIESATLIPMSELGARVPELEEHRNAEIVVHCHHGQRSLHVTMWLKAQGFSDVKSMAGGIDEWSQTIDNAVPRY